MRIVFRRDVQVQVDGHLLNCKPTDPLYIGWNGASEIDVMIRFITVGTYAVFRRRKKGALAKRRLSDFGQNFAVFSIFCLLSKLWAVLGGVFGLGRLQRKAPFFRRRKSTPAPHSNPGQRINFGA